MSPRWVSKPRRTDRLVVGRNVTLTLTLTFACLLAVFQKRIMFGGAGPAESMAGETSQQRN
jgi:hypothetical protein